MPFLKPTRSTTEADSPAQMYRDLPPRPNAVPDLLAHQSEMLNAFADHAEKPDVAIELPTGTGKTLTGLVIAEWTRRSRRARVVYACPTQQLAMQVVAAANRESIKTSLLVGKHNFWDPSAVTAYEAAERIAVTTYNTIFNSRPYLSAADMLLFDDAHAGEQYVGEKYGVVLKRRENADEYTWT